MKKLKIETTATAVVTLDGLDVDAVSERYPEVSFAKLSRIAKRFFKLGKNAK